VIAIIPTLVSGDGTVPKDIGRGAYVLLTSSVEGSTYEWDTLSSPAGNAAVVQYPVSRATRVGPLNTWGVYVYSLTVNRNEPNSQFTTIALNVPETVGHAIAPDPLFDTVPRVRNFSFEIGGASPGYADGWTIVDDANLLASGGGTTRGRIEPTGFTVTSGRFCFCLGDDTAATYTLSAGQVFSIAQTIDLTGVSTLTVEIKFRE
jgi:hypothetical protein